MKRFPLVGGDEEVKSRGGSTSIVGAGVKAACGFQEYTIIIDGDRQKGNVALAPRGYNCWKKNENRGQDEEPQWQ